MESWSSLTSHARVLLCIAHDPSVRLRDIAASVGIADRGAYGIVADLTAAGYVVKQEDSRRNRDRIQAHLPLPEPVRQEPAIGEVLALLVLQPEIVMFMVLGCLPLVVACLGAVLVAPPPAGPGRPVPGVSGRVDDQVGEEVGDPGLVHDQHRVRAARVYAGISGHQKIIASCHKPG
jgi:hypothetical protein